MRRLRLAPCQSRQLPLSVASQPPPLKIRHADHFAAQHGRGRAGHAGRHVVPVALRAAFSFWRAAPTLATTEETRGQAFHILNNFDLSPGAVRTSADSSAGGGVTGIESTEWTAVADLKTRRYYIRTYANSQTRMLDVSAIPADAKEIKSYSIDQKEQVIDLAK